MVAGLTPGMALRDVVFSAGLGALLCVGYCLFGFLFGWRGVTRFLADVLVFTFGAFLLRSAASMRFYAGFVRWYDAVACVSTFTVSYALGAGGKAVAQAVVWACESRCKTSLEACTWGRFAQKAGFLRKTL